MRYPIYFFVLLSGFFYLTGKPLDDKAEQSVTTGVQGQQLAYARKTGPGTVANKSSSQSAPIPVATGLTTPKILTPKPGAIQSTVKVVKTASLKTPAEIVRQGWQTTIKRTKKKPLSSNLSSPSAFFPSNNPPAKPIRKVSNKKLDWTVFGNNRKKYRVGTPAGRNVVVANIPAEMLLEDEPVAKKIVRKSRKKKSAKAKRRKARAKRVSRKRARRAKSRRYARLKRRNRGAYRVARRGAKKRSRKRYASYKSRRKKFGFSNRGGVVSLGGF